MKLCNTLIDIPLFFRVRSFTHFFVIR
jgi:hypothetical protein